MRKKYFPLDKNYLLETAQLDQEPMLIRLMVEHTLEYYLNYCNPLGLEDDLVRRIKLYRFKNPMYFSEFYRDLAGVYRYLNSDNQLEFLFDGSDHYTKYTREWGETFCNWIQKFCQHQSFIKAIFALTVFDPEERQVILGTNRLKNFLQSYFEVKVYKNRGIQKSKAA